MSKKSILVILLAIIFLTISGGCITVKFETHVNTANSVEINFETPTSSTPASFTATSQSPTATIEPMVTETPTLTAESQLGKLVFEENFDDGFASGLNTTSARWEIVDDNNRGKLFQIDNSVGGDWVYFGLTSTTIADGTIEFKVNFVDYSNSSGRVACNFRHTPDERYVLSLVADNNNIAINYQGTDDIWRSLDNAVMDYAFEKEAWYDIRIDFKGNEIITYIDGKKVLTATDDRLKTGEITFSIAPTTVAQFDDLRVWAQS